VFLQYNPFPDGVINQIGASEQAARLGYKNIAVTVNSCTEEHLASFAGIEKNTACLSPPSWCALRVLMNRGFRRWRDVPTWYGAVRPGKCEKLSAGLQFFRSREKYPYSGKDEEKIERMAIKFVGVTFFVLAVYISFESVRKIVVKEIPDPSLVGILLAVASLVIMPTIARIKLRIAKELGMRSLIADSKETFVCTLLSAALLVGLLTRYFFDLWLSDPFVGLIISAYLIYEGREILFE
jgi:hypothetical protein